MTLFVALLLIASFIPATIAETSQDLNNEPTVTGTSPDTNTEGSKPDLLEECVKRMAEAYPDATRARLEEQCKKMRATTVKAVQNKETVVNAVKVSTLTQAEKRLEAQLEKVNTKKADILESLSEEEKEKLASLNRARIKELAEENAEAVKTALKNVQVTRVKKEEAFRERVITSVKLNKAKDNYEVAKNKYAQEKEDYQEAKEEFDKAVKAKNDEDAIRYGKVYLVGATEMVISSLEKVQAQIESNDDLSNEEAEEAIADIEEKIEEMEKAKEKVMKAETKEEVKEAAKTIQNAWKRMRVKVAIHAEKQIQTNVGEVLARSVALERHLERILAHMEEQGEDISDEIDDKIDEFSEKVAEAKDKFKESKELFEEAAQQSTVGSEDGKEEQNRELLAESKELSREAHKLLKEAHSIVMEIVREVKAKGYDIEDDNKYVEIVEEEEEDSEEDEMCCEAAIASCMACQNDEGIEEFCKDNPEIIGCEDYTDEVDTNETEDEPVACCMAMTASCLACTEGISVEEYCTKYPETTGCEHYTVEVENGDTTEEGIVAVCANYPNPESFCPEGEIITIGYDENKCAIYDCAMPVIEVENITNATGDDA